MAGFVGKLLVNGGGSCFPDVAFSSGPVKELCLVDTQPGTDLALTPYLARRQKH
jgi:hypothetical protein